MKIDFRTRIIELMKAKDINQSELSRRTGITQSSLSDYIKGKYSPKQDKIDLIAKALGTTPSYLMGWADIEEPITIAAHHDAEDWTDDELADIEMFKELLRKRREKK